MRKSLVLILSALFAVLPVVAQQQSQDSLVVLMSSKSAQMV